VLDPAVLARYGTRRGWLLLHVGAGTVALLTGPLQLWMGATGRTLRAHRIVGVAYVASVGVGAAAAFYLAAHTTLGWGFGAGLTGLGAAWVLTTTVAVAAVRRGFLEQHREWMIRSYVVTFAFVTFRASWGALAVAGIGTRPEQLVVCSCACSSVPLTRIHPLANLSAQDSRTYLTRRGVAAEHYDAALALHAGIRWRCRSSRTC
jgi:uncharacterized membrane protein